MKQANGTVVYLAHRNVWVGYWNGKIQCSKKTESAANDFLKIKFSGIGALVNMPVKVAAKKAAPTARFSDTRTKLISDVQVEWNKAKALFNEVSMLDVPPVEFYSRGRAAGKAYRPFMGRPGKVAFNEVLAAENPNDFLDTVKHELAHLVVYHRYPLAKAHGREFKHVLIKMGGSGERCHTYDVSSVSNKRRTVRFEYKCDCQVHNMSSVRHSKAQRGVTYTCRKCRTKVVFTGKVV